MKQTGLPLVLIFACATIVLAADPPYPVGRYKIEWDSQIYRQGNGVTGDNWPMAWADDDVLYMSYGDGAGFSDRKDKLSIGFSTMTGHPPDFKGEDIVTNIDTPVGWGPNAVKASGLIMVDKVLYLFVRNYKVDGDTKHSRMAWSKDHGKTWEWAAWYFSDTFGCPEFVQFGRNYEGARDNYVYIISQSGKDPYKRDPGIVMARVPRDKVSQRASYEFFAGMDGKQLKWSSDIAARQLIFSDLNGAQRIAITYNAVLKRYFLTTSHNDGGNQTHTPALGVFEAPEPWGPWSTAYYDDTWSDKWTIHHKFPPKWMSPDGKTMWLVFSGTNGSPKGPYNCFCVRKATVVETGKDDPTEAQRQAHKQTATPFKPELVPPEPAAEVDPSKIIRTPVGVKPLVRAASGLKPGEVIDQAIPGAEGSWMTVHVEAGRKPRSFHVTHEKGATVQGGLGHYIHFDGQSWGAPIQITEENPFRSGVHMAIDGKDNVHFCWGADKKIKYRALIDGKLSSIEIVTDAYWTQGDVTVTSDGRVYVAATPTEKLMVVFERQGPGQWNRQDLPHEFKVWAPTITATPKGNLFVVAREDNGSPNGHATLFWKRIDGRWNEKPSSIAAHNFEANVYALNDTDFLISCYRAGGRVYQDDRTHWVVWPDNTRSQISRNKGQARGQHVGFARTDDGKWWASCSNQGESKEALLEDRTVDQRWRSFYAISSDQGKTWTEYCVTGDESGQGWGNLSANGNWVMMLWPDARENRIRYNLFMSR